MKNEVLVSIIIPSYNTDEELLNRCINSIINQTYKKYEIIIINDGSELHYTSIINHIQEQYPEIIVIHKANEGVSSARNKGIEISTGKYIMFVDADDCLNQTWLEEAVYQAECNNIDIVYGRVKRIASYEQINEIESNNHKRKIFFENELYVIQNYLLLNVSAHPFPDMKYLDLGPYGKLFKKKVLDNIRFDKNFFIGEDQSFNHEVLRNSKKCMIIDKTAYYYIYNKESVSHSYKKNAVNSMNSVMGSIKRNLIEPEKSINEWMFSVLYNFIIACNIEIYNKNSPYKNILEKTKALKDFSKLENIEFSINNVDLFSIPYSRLKIKTYMLKYHLFILLSICMEIRK